MVFFAIQPWFLPSVTFTLSALSAQGWCWLCNTAVCSRVSAFPAAAGMSTPAVLWPHDSEERLFSAPPQCFLCQAVDSISSTLSPFRRWKRSLMFIWASHRPWSGPVWAPPSLVAQGSARRVWGVGVVLCCEYCQGCPREGAESLKTNRFCCSVLRHLFKYAT